MKLLIFVLLASAVDVHAPEVNSAIRREEIFNQAKVHVV